MAIRVFLVDDHAMVRRGLRRILDDAHGIEVVGEADSAASGVEAIIDLRPDVAVVDIELPDGTGADVCRSVHEEADDVRVLLLTPIVDDDTTASAEAAGAHGCVLKRVGGEELVRSVRRASSP